MTTETTQAAHSGTVRADVRPPHPWRSMRILGHKAQAAIRQIERNHKLRVNKTYRGSKYSRPNSVISVK